MKNKIIFLFCAGLLQSCGSSLTEGLIDLTASSDPASETTAANSARIIFHYSNFRSLRDDLVSSASSAFQCLGDVLKVYKTTGDSFDGNPTAFDTTSTDPFAPTERPAFLKNVSVDMTYAYYNHIAASTYPSDVCSYRAVLTEYVDYCAEFDEAERILHGNFLEPQTPANPNPTPTPILGVSHVETFAFSNPMGTGSGYYRVRDYHCAGQGKISSPQIDVTKAYVGGVDVDIDRTQLGAHENLLMVLTYHSMGAEYADPNSMPLPADIAVNYTPNDDETILRVKLQATGMSYAQLISALQPRSRFYSAAPITTVMPDIATFRDPYRGLRSEFIEIPLSADSTIDRIRIERIRGSFILYQMDLYRLGDRS